jgi:hypothetical protein
MKTTTKTLFEAYVDQLREAQSTACRGYGATLVYASDALEDTNSDFDTALDQARALLKLRQDQIEKLAAWIAVVEQSIRDGGREEYTQAIEDHYSK